MFPDNNLLASPNPHIVELDLPSLSTHSRGPGTNTPVLNSESPADDFKPSSFPMFDAQPVAFPPSDVPLEYVRHKLQREAQDFWGNIESSDCTISRSKLLTVMPPLTCFFDSDSFATSGN